MLRALSLLLLLLSACGGGNGSARGEMSNVPPRKEQSIPEECMQLVVVVGEGWDSPNGMLLRFKRSMHGWGQMADPVPVVLGRNGLGWGEGVVSIAGMTGPRKREGDGRAPAGIFHISGAFGLAEEKPDSFFIPYTHLRPGVECVDDGASPLYNRIADTATTPRTWSSSERMSTVMPFYRWGAFVAHNADPVTPGNGSCIFLHIWGGPTIPTSGCTAMEERHLLEILGWLHEDAGPLLVQLPREEYERLRGIWGIP